METEAKPLYSISLLKVPQQDILFGTSEISNKRFVFDSKTVGFKYVYLSNDAMEEGNDAGKAKAADLSYLDFDKPQPDLCYLNANNWAIKKVTIRNCPRLQTLLLFGNGLEEITFEGEFPELELIDLSKNALTKIDLSRANFQSLKHLYLNENKLVDLSGLTDFFVREDFDFNIEKNENSQKPPVEIVSQGKDAVRNWFKATKKKLNEIKVLVVGDAEAGKTSICKRLEFNTFDKNEKQTDGIKIRKFEFEKLKTFESQKKLHSLTGYFWDFGGQEIMKSTHQFFLTHRSVYILVLEARNDKSTEELVTKWLENIQSQGGNSPVIIVINKIEVNPSCGIDPYPLKKPFPQVCGIIKISCENNENLDGLKSLLEKCIPNAELFNTEIDERWIEIKNELQQKTKDKFKLAETDYNDICISHGLTNVKEQKECVKFLNDLGIVLHFDQLDLDEYYILDPLWVTTGVYRIITSEKAAKESGIILYDNLKDIVNSVKIKDDESNVAESNKYSNITYTTYESRYLADIMSRFKLCFFAENKKYVFIPDLFAKETPANEVDEILKNENKLEFIYDYPFLHHSVISRLIVEVNGEIQNFWRTGVIFKSKTLSAIALIRVLNDKVLITITGNKKDKRQYLSQIRFFIEKINEEFNLKPEMKIPLPGLPNRFVKYEHLIAMEKEGVKTYKDWDAIIDFEICKLLEGIDSTEEIQKEGPNTINNYFNINLAGMNPEVIKNITKNTEGFDIDRNQKNKVFISYSSDERGLRNKFERRLNKAFVNSKNSFDTIWSDKEIVTSKDWKQEIQKALQQSNIGVLLVSTSFLSSKYCMYEFQQMLERVKSDGYTIVPVLFRFCHFENSPDLAGMQFVGTYKSEYKGTNPDDGKDLMPFEDLADIDKPKDRLLDRYFIKIVEAIDKAIGG